jgi:hypothetical protein
VVGLQLVPLPPVVRNTLSPAAAVVESALLVNRSKGDSPLPLSLDPLATLWAFTVGVGLLVVFWSARTLFEESGGLRLVSRSVAWMGLAVASISFVARYTAPRLIYGFWTPVTRSDFPSPHGPFVNRNHFATWLILAIPLTAGYVLARFDSRAGHQPATGTAIDARLAALIAAMCLMTGALLSTLSRSGLAGFTVSAVIFVFLARRRLGRGKLAGLLVAVAAVVALAVAYVDVSGLVTRLDDASVGLQGRTAVWREAWPIARDFVATGVGVGAFERGMLVYQQSARNIFVNHAHSQYLQFLIEGGILLVGIVLIAVAEGARIVVAGLGSDRSAVYWIRAGAASGLAAVAVQSVWEVGLRMPANAVLFAIVAAIALCRPARAPDASSPAADQE